MRGLTSTLLGLDETGCTVNADQETSSDLGVKSTRVTGLLDSQHPPDPSNNLVGRRVGGLVKVDHSRPWKEVETLAACSMLEEAGDSLDVGGEITLERRASMGDRSEVTRPNKKLVVVLQQQGPVGGVQAGGG